MGNPVAMNRWLLIVSTVGFVLAGSLMMATRDAVADHEDVIAEKIPLSADTFTLVPVARGFRTPVWGATAPYNTTHLFIVDQFGTITAQPIGDTTDGADAYTFLDVGPAGADLLVQLKTQGFDERGLLGLAFHPHYRRNGLLYTYTSEPLGPTPDFTTLKPDDDREDDSSLSVIREWRVDDPRRPDAVADPTSSRVLMRIEQPQTNHNVGRTCLRSRRHVVHRVG